MKITRGRPKTAGDLAQVSGVKLGVVLFKKPTLSWLTSEEERNLDRKGTKGKYSAIQTQYPNGRQRVRKVEKVRVIKDKVFNPGAGGRESEGGTVEKREGVH